MCRRHASVYNSKSQDLQSQLQRWTVQETDAAQAQRSAEHELSLAAEQERNLQTQLASLQEQLPGREEAYQAAATAVKCSARQCCCH
jgi:chromosome segregation protein